MTVTINEQGKQQNSLHTNRWRIIGWGAALALLLTPLVAMQFTPEVNWTAGDFVFAALMFGTVGLLLELAVRMTRNGFYRAGSACAVLSAFLLVWVNGAVGLVGDEGSETNMLFLVVPVVALLGAIFVQFRGPGMAWAMFAAGTVQAGLAAIFGISGNDMRGGIFTVLLSGLWFVSGALFRKVQAAQ